MKRDDLRIILEVVAGSHAYGLATPASDLDIRGVCFPPARCLLGLGRFEQWRQQDEERDEVIYALAKFANLALACNPNIIEMLFVEPRHIRFADEHGRRLVENRHLFLSKRAHYTFAGYAISQLRRIQRHHRWLVNPPCRPSPEEFGGLLAKGRYKFPDQDAQRAYQAAQKHWKQYEEWRRNRNPARAELERRYGYDTKHALHLFRLLKMGCEILETGQVKVYRPDREWLLGVRHGLLSYEEVVELAASYEARLDEFYGSSTLPKKPDFHGVERLIMEMQAQFLGA